LTFTFISCWKITDSWLSCQPIICSNLLITCLLLNWNDLSIRTHEAAWRWWLTVTEKLYLEMTFTHG
jgi:hypothetical protein